MCSGKPLLIRADASASIGSGHVMRCLALAQAWQARGGAVTVVVRELPQALRQRLQDEEIPVRSLAGRSDSPADAEETCRLAADVGAGWIVADGYQFGTDFQRAVQQLGWHLMVLDDYGHAGFYCADLILNQNIDARESLYAQRDPRTQLLLGTKFVLLRREFTSLTPSRVTVDESANRVLITLGGADPEGVTRHVLRALDGISAGLDVVAVVGSSNRFGVEIEAIAAGSSHQVRIVHNVGDMTELMRWADVAISAGGTTCWELAYLGVPNLIVVLADNQRGIAAGLHENRVSISLGWHADLCSTLMAAVVEELIGDPVRRREMTLRGQALVDGGGANRVCRVLEGE